MNDKAAFTASFSDWRLIKGRKVVQIVFEVPIEKADQAYQVVGGMPDPSRSVWFAIAKLDMKAIEAEKTAKPKRAFGELFPSQQAGILCETEAFHKYLMEIGRADQDSDFAEVVRNFCRVNSRSELDSNPRALTEWKRLEAGYREWMAEPGVRRLVRGPLARKEPAEVLIHWRLLSASMLAPRYPLWRPFLHMNLRIFLSSSFSSYGGATSGTW